ncbi:F0F1 ATP synthase subunit delta [Candidatus Saccharibacteria bacterium]|nr:F0F1 ATP synthase subunit delta [Candidatus Saccharibacteria bacterium]MBP7834631.1 F0F1 ATP synthase subunit delta [Candidatus Saccharibacteria bacterium]
MPSRTQTAQYLATQIKSGDPKARKIAIDRAAAWMKNAGRSKELKYLSLDVAKVLADESGYYFAKVSTANPLSSSEQKNVTESLKKKMNAEKMEVVFLCDESLIGGIKIELPEGMLDSSVKRSLAKLVENIG